MLQKIQLLKATDIWTLLDANVQAAQGAPLARVEAALSTSQTTAFVLDDIYTVYWRFCYIQGREAWLVNGPLIERFCPPLGPGVAERFEWSRKVTDTQFASATVYRERFKNTSPTCWAQTAYWFCQPCPTSHRLRTMSAKKLKATATTPFKCYALPTCHCWGQRAVMPVWCG